MFYYEDLRKLTDVDLNGNPRLRHHEYPPKWDIDRGSEGYSVDSANLQCKGYVMARIELTRKGRQLRLFTRKFGEDGLPVGNGISHHAPNASAEPVKPPAPFKTVQDAANYLVTLVCLDERIHNMED